MDYITTTLDEHPEYKDKIPELGKQAWAEFLRHADDYHWQALFSSFADFQLLFIAEDDLVGVGHTVPVHWDNENDSLPNTIDEAILYAIECRELNKPTNTLAALAIIVSNRHRGRGMSTNILIAMKELAEKRSLDSLIVPVRPMLKSRYPITPFDKYVNWKRTDESPFDPWLRVHWKLGASVLKIIPSALTVEGTVEEWEEWTGMRFPESGEYIVEGAFRPIVIDREKDIGRYEEPNLWMIHTISPE